MQGPARFAKAAIIGGIIGGVLSGIPLFSALNCCFCMLNMAGAGVGISIYLKENPSERLNAGDAAICGGMAGSIAGFTTSILNMISSLLIGPLAASLYSSVYSGLPPSFSTLMQQTGSGILSIPVNIIVYGAFGALGGFLAMQLFFKDRLAPG